MKLILFALALTTVAAAPAQTFFSTLAPGDSYLENVGRAVSGSSNSITGSYGEWGWQFTSLATGDVAQLKVGAHWLVGTNRVAVRIHSNGAGETMGSILASYSIADLPAFNAPEHVTVLNIANPSVHLTSGSKYWISMAPEQPDTYAAWMDSDQGRTGRMSVSSDGVNYGYVNNMPYSAFSLSAVPEPTSLIPLTGGILLLIGRRRRAARA